MTARIIADPRVNVENFKVHMVQFLTLAAGGPAEYSGREIGAVHKGMRITNNEFDAMVGDIKASMDRLGIATREKRDLLAIIETTRKEIVEKK
jgi:hemoglobin